MPPKTFMVSQPRLIALHSPKLSSKAFSTWTADILMLQRTVFCFLSYDMSQNVSRCLSAGLGSY